MALSAPTLILQPFATAGTKNVIPDAASPTPGLASYNTGYPPVNFLAKASGGIPPAGADANGVQFDVTSHIVWAEGGNGYSFSSAFATAIGGYPIGAVLRSASTPGLYFYNTTAANSNDPDAVAFATSGWAPFNPLSGATGIMSDAPTTGTHNDVVCTLGTGFYECTPGGAVTITGFDATKFVDGARLIVSNLHASNLLTLGARTGSAAGNQLRLATALTLLQYQQQSFVLSKTLGFWIPL